MDCAYGGPCEGVIKPFWIRSVGIPLCGRHEISFKSTPDLRSRELLTAAAVAVLRAELTGRELAAA